ncbi:MAG TPA: hypothetical protein VH277_13805 [Gemmatimonadaceae bacterium]|jgi:hypothetical protein|nr:hypothetical protein [Gemmatimonadaceae bacterium]
MLATNGPRWFDRTTPDPRWPSVGISLLITAAMFSTALVAMRSFAPWRSAIDEVAEKPVVVRLVPAPTRPAPRPPKLAEERPVEAIRPPVPVPTAIPTTIAPVTTPQHIGTPTIPTVAVLGAPSPANDSTAGAAGRRSAASATATVAAGVYAHGAPIARAGVVLPPRTLDTPAVRDSILKVRMAAMAEMAKKPPTGDVAAMLEQSQRVAERMARRATTAGNSADIHVPMGSGVDGVGADKSGLVSIPFPLFYPGPSPEQRKHDEAIYRDYLAALSRLQKRVATKRDSILADSVRADSIAKARPKIVP